MCNLVNKSLYYLPQTFNLTSFNKHAEVILQFACKKIIAAGVANIDVILKLFNTYYGKLKADTPKNINLKKIYI